MNYFLDTEFTEGTQQKRFLGVVYGKTAPTIDLISIGMTSEDGRAYYAVSKDFNLREAWERYDLKEAELSVEKKYWLREKVLKPIWAEFSERYQSENMGMPDEHYAFSYRSLKVLIGLYGKTNEQIKQDLLAFVVADEAGIDFYGYYCDYNWVVFCWLFGKMIDLPEGFPRYCRDLKQTMDHYRLGSKWKEREVAQSTRHHALDDAWETHSLYEAIERYTIERRTRSRHGKSKGTV
jgi:hypothetical protein